MPVADRVQSAPLILVVGPSGVGKDTLLRGAREALAPTHRFAFPRREVTRPPDRDEDSIQVSPPDFSARRAAGAYCLWWQAHDHCYGVPREAGRLLSENQAVAVNASRTVVEEARRRFDRVAVVQVSAPPDVLHRRLAARGRESAGAIRQRLNRVVPPVLSGPEVIEIVNDGPPAEGIDAFVRALERLHPTKA